MNIFEALSQGKGSINEENTSSFLAYLLKDYESHGLRREFAKRFIKLANIDYKDVSDYNFIVELEKKYYDAENNTKKNRTIDILLTITDDYKKYIIGIENKLSSGACQKDQLLEEYKYIKQTSNKDDSIIMIFLVPDIDNPKILSEFQALKTWKSENESISEQQNVKLIKWDDIINIVKEMLADETEAAIAPMSDYLKQTLKAFCFYIKHLNSTIIKQKVYVRYKRKDYDELYELLQLSDGSMRIRCENSKDLMPKLMIFDILFKLKPEIYKKERMAKEGLSATKIIEGTPRELGRMVFDEIKKMKSKSGEQEIIIDDENPLFDPQLRRTGSNEY